MSEFTNIDSNVIETVIGPKTKFEGSVNTDKPIKIEGHFEGTIDSTNIVIVEESAYFNGKIICKELDLIGEVNGEVKCSEVLKFAIGGKFKGDAIVANVDIHPGADFDGTLKITK